MRTIDLGEAAQRYASYGWRVFPVAPRAKLPLTANGYKDATADLETIADWWQRWPDANIGLACGPSGLIALDGDPAHYSEASRALLDKLLGEYATTTQTTPTDGRHFIYELPSDTELNNSRRGLPPGFDVRVNGFILLAPSEVDYHGDEAKNKNVADGHTGRYTWLPNCAPRQCSPRPLPDEILELLRPAERKIPVPPVPIHTNGTNGANGKAYGAAALDKELDTLARTREGSRNNQLNTAAFNLGQLVAGGELDGSEVREKLMDTAIAIGLEEREAAHTVGSGLAAGMQRPRSAPPKNVAGVYNHDGATPVQEHDGLRPGQESERTAKQPQHAEDETAAQGSGDAARKPSQAEILYTLASQHAEIFTGQDGTAYAFVPVKERRECYRLTDSNFAGWLTALYRTMCGGAMPGAEGRKEAIAALTYDARTTRREVFVRVGAHGGRVYIDLGTEEWDAIEIDDTGWRIVDRPPVAFRRPASLRPLPLPLPGAKPALLRQYLNLEPEQWPLVAAWWVAAANPTGPYPVLAFAGEQGSAKSTNVRVLKETLDPAAAGLRGQPEDIRDLWIGANNGWVLAYDNVSHLSNDVSDALCRLATGGGYAKRANYSDDGEFLMDAQRPVIINGIGDIVTRPDLMDRTILIAPPVIPEDQRRNEKEFWRAFDQDRPKLLGALLDALSAALVNIGHTQLETLPRMADFALLAVAAEPAYKIGDLGFLEAYSENREEAHATVIETSTLGEHLRAMILLNGTWEGTASELLATLNERAGDSEKRSKSWPNVPNRIKPTLQRLAPSLRHIGVGVEFPPRTMAGRRIRLVRQNV